MPETLGPSAQWRHHSAAGLLWSFLATLLLAAPLPAFAAPATDSLVGYWKFDETVGGTFADSSGDGNTGTGNGSGGANSTPQPSADVAAGFDFTNNRSLVFDGTDDYVDTGSDVADLNPASSFTAAAWIKPTLDSADHFIVGNAWGAVAGWQIRVTSSNTFRLILFDAGGNEYSGMDSNTLSSGWAHVVGVWNGSSPKVYVNGAEQSVTAIANGTVNENGSSNVTIGASPESGNRKYFGGTIDDLRLYNRALSAAEIAELAAGRHTTAIWDGSSSTNWETAANWNTDAVPDPYTHIIAKRSGSGSPVLAATVSGASLTIEGSTSLDLHGYNFEFTDSGQLKGGGTLKLLGSESVQNLSNVATTSTGTVLYYGTGSYSGLAAGSSYNNLTINDGLVGYWKLDDTGGIRAVDSSGHGNSGTLIGGATISTTVAPTNFTNARSVSFDGTDDYVLIPTSTSLKPTAISVSFWMKSTDSDGVVILGGSGVGEGFQFYLTGQMRWLVAFTLSSSNIVTGSTTVNDGRWHHIVGTYSAGIGGIWVDGALDASQFATGTGDIPWGSTDWNIGRNGGAANQFAGVVDDVRIYNRALSAQEVQALAAGSHPSSALGTYTLGSNLAVAGALTINAGTLDVSSSNYAITLSGSLVNNGGKFTARKGTITLDGSSSAKVLQTGGQRLNALTISAAGAWTLHDRLTLSGALTQTAGTLNAGSGSYAIHAQTLAQSAGTFIPRAGTIILNGSTDQTVTAASALNNLRIEDPTENGLVGYWKFDEMTGTVARDASPNGNNGTLTNGPAWSGSSLNTSIQFVNSGALKFDGTDDYVALPAMTIGTNDFTWSAWARPAALGGYQMIMSNASTEAYASFNGTGFEFEIDVNGVPYAPALVNSGTFNNNTWYHISCVRNGNATNIYVNGVLTGTTGGGGGPANLTSSPFAIGRWERSSNNYFNGSIDDVRIYNRALSANEVANLARGRYAAGGSSTATFTLGGNLSTTSLALDSGVLDTSSRTVTVTNALQLLRGNGSLTHGSSTLTLNGGLTLSGALLTGGAGTIDMNGNVLILTGSLVAPSGAMAVSGDWTKNGGTFTHNGGLVSFDGSSTQTLQGSTAFNDLSVTASAARTVRFGSGTLLAVADDLTLTGADGALLTLSPLVAATTWYLDVADSGTQDVSYVSASYSNASSGAVILANDGTSMNGGNNVNWQFVVPEVSFQSGSLTLSEAAGSATVVIVLSGSSLLDITIPYAFGGTATGTGTDYTVLTPSPLVLEAGETSTGIVLQLVDDSDIESDETITFTIGTPVNALAGSTGAVTVTLTSADAAASSSSASSASVPSTAGQVGVGGGGGGGGHRGSPEAMRQRIAAARNLILARFEGTRKESERLLAEEEEREQRLAEKRREGRETLAARVREERIAERIRDHEAALARLQEEQRSLQKLYAQRREERIQLALTRTQEQLAEEEAALLAQQEALREEQEENRLHREQRLAQIERSSSVGPSSKPSFAERQKTIADPSLIAQRRNRLFVLVDSEPVLYKDVLSDSWYAPYVAAVITQGIAQGYKTPEGNLTGEFGVANAITRAEVLKMALEAVGVKPAGGSPRNDTAKGTWAAAYVATAESMSLSAFAPDTNVHVPATRGEVVQTILEAMNFPIAAQASSFNDVPADHPYANAIATAAFFGFIEGDTTPGGNPLNRFRPDEPINRAEVSKIIALVKEIGQ